MDVNTVYIRQKVTVRHIFWSARPLRRMKSRDRIIQWSARPDRRMEQPPYRFCLKGGMYENEHWSRLA